ncbi:hypothetical protein A33Q_1372 [Indibacter alkaliphilus LW1]|uniref:Uncharacterized protein n=1 Tax=Indibacter alkaliphilus (strain CCUG 57479 / KCTC 22604 / LW1) TaxID=1189612 RepID=S2E8S9_INDAL|nr:hypothetical protein A33Q_1372 [Indibacter alkaliphilus LW1]
MVLGPALILDLKYFQKNISKEILSGMVFEFLVVENLSIKKGVFTGHFRKNCV